MEKADHGPCMQALAVMSGLGRCITRSGPALGHGRGIARGGIACRGFDYLDERRIETEHVQRGKEWRPLVSHFEVRC